MKKITALFLIVSFLFNLFGYRLVIEYLQYKANTQLEASLDKNLYEDSQLIELKVPLEIPYQSNWSTYQRYDGEIEIGGRLFKYVERKVANDTLYLKCIVNDKKMHLETIKNNYFKATSDIVQNGDAKKTGNSKDLTLKNLQGEYENFSFVLNTIAPHKNAGNCWSILVVKNLFSSPRISPEQPPDFLETSFPLFIIS
ncbi:MAG: hypothetical protein K2Q21_01360 [Chitinophagaceae bacterium]|nr:hypothetical protein [Chitinophagaceae bacterium]